MMQRLSRKARPIIYSAVAVALVAMYFIFDPSVSGWMPKCVFHSLTGYDCPGCGAQRMLHALLHGDFASAWKANAFLLCAFPLLALLAFSACFRTRFPRLYRIVNSVPVIIVTGVAMVVWTLYRNFA